MMVTAVAKRKAGVTGRRVWLRRLFYAAITLIALPFVLTPAYRFVDPVSTLMLADFVTGKGIERQTVGLDDINPYLVHAVIMAEDGRFCTHRGVDWGAVSQALDEQGRPRGASTIPMQTVKNLFLWPSRSYVRKAIEVPLAYWADFVLGKRRLMEVYLNVAKWGDGIYGVEAAARHYYGVPSRQLGRLQAALLVAALPNPNLRNPGRPGPQLMAAAGTVAARADRAGSYVGCLKP